MLQYNISNTTLWVVVGFLLVTLVLGLYAGRGIKDIKEYALGSGRFSTLTLVITFLATNIGGGSIIGVTKATYKIGIIVTVACFGVIIQYLLFAFVIGPKIKLFKDCLTIGDLSEKLYGKKIKVITGVLTLICAICKGAIQLLAIGKICEILLNVNHIYVILIASLVLGIYSSIGGIKSVIATDILQFIVIIIVFPLIASIILHKVGSYKELFTNLPQQHLSIFTNKEFYYYLTFFLIWSFLPMSLLNPADMQRVFMASSKIQVKKQFLMLSIFDPIFRIVVMLIGLGAIILYPILEAQNVLPKIINDLLSPSLRGLAISGIIAVIMSTADSHFHAAGLLFTHDIIAPISNSINKKINELPFARLSTISLVTLSAFVAIKSQSLFDLSIWAAKFSGPGLLFPLLIGILGIKTNKKTLIVGMFSGISLLFISEYYLPVSMKMLSIPIGIIVNGIAFMIFHILQNKGIAWIKRDQDKKEEKLWIPNPKKILQKIKNYIPTPKKIYNYSRFQVMKHGSENMIFGIYCCVNFTFPYFLWDSQDPEKYNLMTNLRFIGGIMAGLLIVKDEWKKFLKPYYPLYWHATLTYCLPFITTVMFLLSGGSLLWLIQVAISIFFLIMLVAGEVFLILAPLGILLGLVFYKYFVGPINILSLGFDINYYLIYAFFFPTIIGLLFAYKKKIFNKETSNIGINLGLSLCHEIRNTLSALSYSELAVMKMNSIERNNVSKNKNGEEVYIINKNSFKSIHDDMNNALGLNYDSLKVLTAFENLFLEYKKSNINLEIDTIEETVRDTLSDLHFLPDQLERIELDLRDDFFIELPKAQFAFVLSNIIRNAFKHGGPSKVEIKSENKKLIIRDDGKGIPELDTERIFQMHYTTGKKGDSSGIGLWFSKIIITSFNGEIFCKSQEGENSYTEFIIKFPEIDPSKIIEEDRKRINEKKTKRLRKLEKEEIAKTMLEKGDSIEKIEERTGLSSSEIKEIKNKINY